MSLPWLPAILDDDGGHGRLQAFRRFLLLHGCVRSWLWFGYAVDVWQPGLAAAALLMSAAFALAWLPRFEALAPRVALPALALQLTLTLPTTDNHFFVELFGVALLCLAEGDGRNDDALVLASLRWLAVIVLFHTGLQKVLYGHYFTGDFLAFMVGRGERFASFFQLLLPADEIARLQGYDPLKTGQGPYRVTALPFVLASNLVWIAEMGLAVLLTLRRTRGLATFGAIALVVAIQLAAREVGFGLLFANLLLLFTASGNRRVLPWLGLVYGYALGAAAGLLPGGAALDPGWL